MTKEKIFCKECNQQTDLVIDVFARYHLKKCHGMNMKQYYDKHIKKDGEGVCIDCDKETTFYGHNRGYAKRCSFHAKRSDDLKRKVSESYKTRDMATIIEKYKKTCVERFGVEHPMKNESHINRVKNTNMKKYGAETTLQIDVVKNARLDALTENAYEINEKRRNWWEIEENVECVAKTRRDTLLRRYGVEFTSQILGVWDKIRKTNERNGMWTSLDDMDSKKRYWLDVKQKTYKNKIELLNNWDGLCFYSGIPIIEFTNEKGTHNMYPTIDHKISIFYGYLNGMTPDEIADINNLCISCRIINTSKNIYNIDDEVFVNKLPQLKEKAWKLYQQYTTATDIK